MARKKQGGIAAVILGVFMFGGSFPLLFWNEGRSVHRIQALAEGRDVVVANVSPKAVDPNNQDKLVHITGFAEAPGQLVDPLTNVTADDVLKLVRKVEMYQWEENDSSDRDRAPTYDKTWSEVAISSSDFEDSSKRNPELPYSSQTMTADPILFGAFRLGSSLAKSIKNYEQIDVASFFAEMPETLQGTFIVDAGGFYAGGNPEAPEIGDVRIKYSVARPTIASVIAQQSGETFQDYSTKTVKNSIERLEVGQHSADEMFDHMETENVIMTWALRAGGSMLMFMGMMFVLSPLQTMLGYIPIVGNLANTGIGFAGMLLTVILSLTTIAVAWFFYRPLLSFGLMGVVAVACFLLSRMGKPKSQFADDDVIEDARIRVVE